MEFHGWKVAVNSCQQFAPLALYLSKFRNRRELSFWSTSLGKRPASLCQYGLRDAASRGQRPTMCDKLKLKGGVLQLHLQSMKGSRHRASLCNCRSTNSTIYRRGLARTTGAGNLREPGTFGHGDLVGQTPNIQCTSACWEAA